MNDEQQKRAEQRGYAKGYAAGRRRRAKAVNYEHQQQQNAARFDRFMCAAMTGLIACGGWQTGGKPNKSATDFAGTAAEIATAMMKKGPRA
jgi:hypothetical protein